MNCDQLVPKSDSERSKEKINFIFIKKEIIHHELLRKQIKCTMKTVKVDMNLVKVRDFGSYARTGTFSCAKHYKTKD